MRPLIELAHIPFSLVEQVATIIEMGTPINNRELLALCIGSGIDGFAIDPHLCHEVAETALNFLIQAKYGKELLRATDPSTACSGILKPLYKRLPTQSWRSAAQVTYQQFSTPAPIAYLASYLLNLHADDVVLEPSCGTGSLAVWARAADATVITNEIDVRRRALGRLLGFDPTGHDAEFIDDLLPASAAWSVVLANPPFSSSGGRVEKNQSRFGFRHVESALRRLADGGRFAVILGESGAPRTQAGRVFWDSLLPDVRVTGAIGLPGREYYRNGTTVGVTLILGRKLTPDERESEAVVGDIANITASSVEDAFDRGLAAGLRFSPLPKSINK